MKLKFFTAVMFCLPVLAIAAERTDSARVGVSRASVSATRLANVSTKLSSGGSVKTLKVSGGTGGGETNTVADSTADDETGAETTTEVANNASCRDAYRQCMDDFCLLDESEGYRCACSSNINKSKSIILEIQSIQDEADKLYSEGVEREKLAAKAKYVFGESKAAQQSSSASGISFSAWLNGSDDGDDSLGGDADIGDDLYAMAAEYCADQLESCGKKAEMEEKLYARMVTQDCKGFESYLADQKRNAEANKRTAEKAVRTARLEMFDTTNKYNRGECLLAYRSCIADKGGCGSNFENCMEDALLERRAKTCDNILDQCTASREYVLADWTEEKEYILAEAAKYTEKHERQTCLARIQMCLEDNCSTATNSACLTDVNVAAEICTVIKECDEKISGIQTLVNDKLKYLGFRFCENDVDKCLQDKCGKDYSAPACLGKSPRDIAEKLCPQELFPSCKDLEQFDVIVSSAMLQMDYQQLQGCVNYFDEQLGKVCGTDMACLPEDTYTTVVTELPTVSDGEDKSMVYYTFRQQMKTAAREKARAAVDDFFKKQFQKDTTVAACISGVGKQSSDSSIGNVGLGESVFNSAKLIAQMAAENRAVRTIDTDIGKLIRAKDAKEAEQLCLNTYKVEAASSASEQTGKKGSTYETGTSYISSVAFEPSLKNCHVCRKQRTCETGGESKGTGFAKGAAGGLTAGASAGTMVNPGWGTAIGSVVGAVGGGVMGMMAADEKDYCNEIESCEDINIDVVSSDI